MLPTDLGNIAQLMQSWREFSMHTYVLLFS